MNKKQAKPLLNKLQSLLGLALLALFLCLGAPPVQASLATDATATPANLTIATWGEYNAAQQNLPNNLYDVVAVAAGYEHSVALKRDGTVVSWGNTPPAPAGLNNVVKIAAGRYGTLALKNDGTLVAWGSANFGQLDIPAGLSGVVGMAMGDLHSVAVKQDGTVVVWGRGLDPKLKAPAGLSDVVAVSASAEHNLALKRDGTVVAWGQSFSLGLQVPTGLSGVVAIAAGSNLDVALKSDGTVVTWGSADNTMNPPAGLTDVIAIDVDQYHAVALKRDGTLVKWGYAYLLNIPNYAKGVNAVALGYGHTLALLTDTTAPETTLVRGPASPNPNAATFEFGGTDDLFSNQQALRFECSLNGGVFTACANPASFSGLPGGNLTLAVRAQDAAGNVDATPATYTWMQCGDAIDASDETALQFGFTCFNQRTAPGIFTIRMTGDIALSATPVAANSTANLSLLIEGQDHIWNGLGRGLNGLQVKPGTTVTVQKLTIRDAYSQIVEAGGIYNQGNLTLEHMTVEGNRSPSVGSGVSLLGGGGIANYGTLTVRNSTIRNNRAVGFGGGIGNWAGTATIENSLIAGNYAYAGSGLHYGQETTTTLTNVIFAANTSGSASGGQISGNRFGTLNGAPTIVPTCYWLESSLTGQVLTIPNQSNTAGTALVTAAKQTPANGHQLWLLRADNALVSLPTGQLVTVQGAATADMTAVVIQPETPGAASQRWSISLNGLGNRMFYSQLNGYPLTPVDQTTEQTPVVVRNPSDYRYFLWWMVEAPPTDCLAAMPVSAASAPAISEIEAPSSLDQLPADALEKFNAALQPEPVTAEEPNTPSTEQPVPQNITQAQRIFLPLVSK